MLAALNFMKFCGESNGWPQFPVTLKTRVVEINAFNAYKTLECVTINRKISATAYVLQKTYLLIT